MLIQSIARCDSPGPHGPGAALSGLVLAFALAPVTAAQVGPPTPCELVQTQEFLSEEGLGGVVLLRGGRALAQHDRYFDSGVFVYEAAPAWSETGSLKSYKFDDAFGSALDMVGDTIAVGAPDVGAWGANVEGLAYDPVAGVVYATQPDFLLTIDQATGIGVNSWYLGVTLRGLAFDPGAGWLYGVGSNPRQLYSVDPVTAAVTEIGPLGFEDVSSLAFDSATGELFAVDRVQQSLLTIDPSTGQAQAIGSLGNFVNVRSLTVDPTSGLLHAVNLSGNELMRIDRTTGAGAIVGSVPSTSAFRALAATPGGVMYGVDKPAESLKTISTANGATSTVGLPIQNLEAGEVRIFERDAGGVGAFGEVALLRLQPLNGNGLVHFGKDLAFDGPDRLAIGAPGDVAFFGGKAGACHILQRDLGGPDNWGSFQVLTALEPKPGDYYGLHVDLDGDRLMVLGTGPIIDWYVDVYERSDPAGPWLRTASFDWRMTQPVTLHDLVISGDLAVLAGGDGTEAEVQVFRRMQNGAWELDAVFGYEIDAPTTGSAPDVSVDLSGDLLAVGIPNPRSKGDAVHLYRRAGGVWTEISAFAGLDTVASDGFGFSVSLDGPRVLVGAFGHSHVGPGGVGSIPGAAYLFEAAASLPGSIQSYCTAGTSSAGCQAVLCAGGTPSATLTQGFSVSAEALQGGSDGLWFFGSNGQQAQPWGNGTSFQCVVPPVVRTPLVTGAGTPGSCDGRLFIDLNATWCPSCPSAAKNPGAGSVVQAQLWYRDPLNTSNQTTSLSDAIEFTLAP